MVDVVVEWILNVSIILNTTAHDSSKRHEWRWWEMLTNSAQYPLLRATAHPIKESTMPSYASHVPYLEHKNQSRPRVSRFRI